MALMTKEWKGQETYPIDGFHHVEFFVGNAKQAAHFYRSAFGFEPHAYSGPETGQKDQVSYVLRQNRIFIVLTTPLNSRHPAASWLKEHGDSVHDIAFSTTEPELAFSKLVAQGGVEAYAPRTNRDNKGIFKSAGIRTYGSVIHSLIDDTKYLGPWAPGFIELKLPPIPGQPAGLVAIDHIVGNVGLDQMDRWVRYYEKVFGFMSFVEFDETDISTRYSALKSKVVRSRNWQVKMPINEPAKGLRKSQIQEYLECNEGEGVQHLALSTHDIVQTITALRANGVEFLPVPDSYYEELGRRVGDLDEDIEKLKRLQILVDRDETGYLLQLFTRPLEDRPTFFIEIIERKGAIGFGQGNFQALFEAIEREQALRGNL